MRLEVRSFREQDINCALAQTAREGWDSTAELFRACLAHDADGCFVGEIDGRPVAMITTTRYATAGWIGNLIVEPEHRKQGIGYRMMTRGIQHLESHGVRTIRLEADPMGVELYRRLGFEDQFESLRFRREPRHEEVWHSVGRLTADNLSAAIAFDRECFGDDRGRLVGLLHGTATAAYWVCGEEDVHGYALVLPSRAGVRIGPWVAIDRAVAVDLLTAVLAGLPDKPVVVSVPCVNHAAIELLELKGFHRTPSSLRMIRGDRAAESHAEKLFATVSGATG